MSISSYLIQIFTKQKQFHHRLSDDMYLNWQGIYVLVHQPVTIKHHYTANKNDAVFRTLNANPFGRLTIKAGGRGCKSGKTVKFLEHCPYNRNGIINCAWPKNAAIDNQLLAEMNRVLYKSITVLCRVWCSAHFPLTIAFVDASQFKLISNVFQLLFICLFTRSHKSCVLFLLLLCIVLVLYSYQESTLLWRPWIPLMRINCV